MGPLQWHWVSKHRGLRKKRHPAKKLNLHKLLPQCNATSSGNKALYLPIRHFLFECYKPLNSVRDLCIYLSNWTSWIVFQHLNNTPTLVQPLVFFFNTVFFSVMHHSNKCCKQSSLLKGIYCQASNYGMLISQEFDIQEQLCLCNVGLYILKNHFFSSGAVFLTFVKFIWNPASLCFKQLTVFLKESDVS